MVERLPKDCTVVVENLAKALGHDLKLGVKIDCGKLVGNRFKLVAAVDYGKFNQEVFYVKVAHEDVTIPEIKSIFNAVWPDFLLKPTSFMPIDRLVSEFKLDKEKLSAAVLKGIRSRMKKCISDNFFKTGVCIYLATCSHGELGKDANMPRLKSFSEFLVWVDLNVK